MSRRLLARLIDGFVLLAPVILVVHAITQSALDQNCVDEGFAFEQCTQSGSWFGLLAGYWLGLFALTAVYEVVFLAALGATPGKWVLNVRVLDASTGRHVSAARALVRYAVLCVTGSVFTIGWWSPLFDRSGWKRGWHDRAGRTVVVRSP